MNQENSSGTALAKAESRSLHAYLQGARAAKDSLRKRPTENGRSFFKPYAKCDIPRFKLEDNPQASALIYIPIQLLDRGWLEKTVEEMQRNYDNLDAASYLSHEVKDPEVVITTKDKRKFPKEIASIRCTAHIPDFQDVLASFKANGVDLGYPEDFEGCLVCEAGAKLQKTFWGTLKNPGVVYSDPEVYPYLEQWTADFIEKKLNGEELDFENPEHVSALNKYVAAKISDVDNKLIRNLAEAHAGSVRPIRRTETKEGFPAARFILPVFVINVKKEKVVTVTASGRERIVTEDAPVYNEDGTPDVQLMFLDLPGKFLVNNFIQTYAKSVANESSSLNQDTEANYISEKAYQQAINEQGKSKEEAEEYADKAWELKKTLPNSFVVVSYDSVSDKGVDHLKGYTIDRHNWDRALDETSGFNNPEIIKIRDYCNELAENFPIPDGNGGVDKLALTPEVVQSLVYKAELMHYEKINQLINPVVSYWSNHHSEVTQKNLASYGAGSSVASPAPPKGARFSTRLPKQVEGGNAPVGTQEPQRLPLEPPVPAQSTTPVVEVMPDPMPVRVTSSSSHPVQQTGKPAPSAQDIPKGKPVKTTKKNDDLPFI